MEILTRGGNILWIEMLAHITAFGWFFGFKLLIFRC